MSGFNMNSFIARNARLYIKLISNGSMDSSLKPIETLDVLFRFFMVSLQNELPAARECRPFRFYLRSNSVNLDIEYRAEHYYYGWLKLDARTRELENRQISGRNDWHR